MGSFNRATRMLRELAEGEGLSVVGVEQGGKHRFLVVRRPGDNATSKVAINISADAMPHGRVMLRSSLRRFARGRGT